MTLLLGMSLFAAHAAAQSEVPTRDAAWDAAFDRDLHWKAGDIGHAIDLGDGRTLWLFGDSIVGPAPDDDDAVKKTMVRGAVAWHITPEGGAAPDSIEFAAPEPGHGMLVAEWTQPPKALWPDDTWYWLMGDGRVVKNAKGAQRFVFFASAIGPAGNPEGMWNFRRVGGAIITVGNPGETPDKWVAEQVRNPLVGETPKFGEPAKVSENWGLAIVTALAEEEKNRLYVYGLREAPLDSQLLVARCEQDALDRPDEWRFFDGSSWVEDPTAASPVAHGLVSEFTVQPIKRDDRLELVLIQSEPMLGRHVLARTAAAPEGPWSEPKQIYEVKEPSEDKRLMTYAAKGHAHLSRPGELLITYALNSSDIGQIFREPRIYRPHFVRVRLDALPEAPAEP